MEFDTQKKQLREFGFLISFTFPIVIGWIIPLIGGKPFQIWTLWRGIFALIFSIIKPILLFYPFKVWMFLGYILSRINSTLILGLIFFIVLLPIAMIMKIFGHDPLNEKKTLQKSYRELKNSYKIDLDKIF